MFAALLVTTAERAPRHESWSRPAPGLHHAPGHCSSPRHGRTFRHGCAAEHGDDALADAPGLDTEGGEHLGGNSLAFATQPKEDVLRTDVAVAELERLAQRELEHLLGAGSER